MASKYFFDRVRFQQDNVSARSADDPSAVTRMNIGLQVIIP